ncbi:uncharacterized protein LOC113232338, partial [Hyposmocoma kahamanoa]|uniref:uncharacterized protein LOC113232338 n=1 Tax=Hyposmocoma kahamanoa TaxID=1477025 RepID=UPI000E6D98F9
LFENCTCGYQRAVRGSCSLSKCSFVYALYLVLHTLVLGVSGASMLMQGMVLLRAVQRWDKPIALGLCFGIVGLLSEVPGHLLYLLISSLTCAYENPITGGVCVFHNSNLMWVAVASSLLCLSSAVVCFINCRVAAKQQAAKVADQ